MNTKEKIIHTAFMIFLENGFRSTTYNELVKAAGVSKGAFYHYYKSKEVLFTHVIDSYFGNVFDKVQWSDYKDLGIVDLEKILEKYYTNFSSKITNLTGKGLSRYFILFFEAMEIYPEFQQKVQLFYKEMKEVLDGSLSRSRVNETDGFTPSMLSAVDIISKHEGYLFWRAVFPGG